MSGEGSRDRTNDRWAGRPFLARFLQIVLFIGPFVIAFVVTLAVAKGLPDAEGRPGQFLRLLLLISISIVVMLSSDRVARLAAPVSLLLQMTMIFPDKAPNRVKVAMRSSSTEELRRTLLEVDESGLGGTASEAAETLMVLVAALSRHDRLTRGHSERVRAYTDIIAGELGLTTDDRSKLRWAALLHDVGKMRIPSEILNKPGKLTATEYEIVKQHPLIGAELVEPLRDFLGPWADTVLQHHERWEGGGYPAGIAGTDICYGARIVAVADTFDVITSLRSYKKPASATGARQEIARCSGTQFDPDVVKAFLQIGLGRFRWSLAPMSFLTQFPQLVGLLSPVAGGATTVMASAAPVVMAGVATMGLVNAVEPAQPTVLADTGSEIGVELEPATDSTTVVITRTSTTGGASTTTISASPTTADPIGVTESSVVSLPPTSGSPLVVPTAPVVTTERLVTTAPPTTAPPTTARPTTAPPTTARPTTAPPTTARPTTAPPTTVSNAPDGPLPRVIGDCLGIPGITAVEFRQGTRDMAGCDLNADGPLDLSGFDLSGAHVDHGDWSNTDFTNADLTDAKFHRLALTNADFKGADLSGTEFKDFDLQAADFRGADLTSTTFERGALDDAIFSSSVLTDVDFRDVDLPGATFNNSVLDTVYLKNINLRNASFNGAALFKVNLERSTLTGADFRDASLVEVKIQDAQLGSVDFRGADLNDVNFDEAERRANFGSTGGWVEVKCPDGSMPPTRGCVWDD